MGINPDFLKPYSPKDNEADIYKKWDESGYFNPDVCVEKGVTAPDAPTFSIVLPPPNVTGVLHMGCLLYTSDAADEEDSVSLGGRRMIKEE